MRDYSRKESSRSPAKRNRLSSHVGHSEVEHLLAGRGLPRRTFRKCVVQPAHEKHDSEKSENESDSQEGGYVVTYVFAGTNSAEGGPRARQYKKGNQEDHEGYSRNYDIDQVGDESKPKTGVRHAAVARACRGNRCQRHWRAGDCSQSWGWSNKDSDRLAARRAECRRVRNFASAF